MKYFGPVVLVFLIFLLIPLNSDAEGRSVAPFSFDLNETVIDDELFFYVNGGKINLIVRNGETATFPLTILSGASEPTSVDFHATIDNSQIGPIRFPPGVNIKLEPSHMVLRPDENQILNITVIASEKAPSSKYDIKLVGVWPEFNGFMGTSFSLHVGDDFGNDAIPINLFMAPLKFYKEGVSNEEIICRNNLILILKNNDKPACVREETKPKLIERGWMKTQVNIHDDSAFIESTKSLDEVQLFLYQHPQAQISVDHEWFVVMYEQSGFKEHPTSSVIYHNKRLYVNLDYEGKPAPFKIECGGPVSMETESFEQLQNPDWCFPADQTRFQNKKPEPEPARITEDEINLIDAKQKLQEIYSLNSSFGPFNIRDVIVGYGIAGDVLVVDVLTEYYESDHLDLIKQKIRDIVGHKVTIEFSPSGAIVPTNIGSVFPYVWNSFLHRNGIEFTPKEQTYWNNADGFLDVDRVCSPIVASNGTEFYISSIFILEPFEITGTFIDKTMPADCHKVWKTDTILVEPDRILSLWLENYHSNN